MRCSAAELTAHLGGELVGPDVSIEGASIDSDWSGLSQVRRQLLGDKTVDPFYRAAGELPLDPRSADAKAA